MDGEVISAGYLFSLSYVMSVQFQDHGCHLTEDRCCVLQGGWGWDDGCIIGHRNFVTESFDDEIF